MSTVCLKLLYFLCKFIFDWNTCWFIILRLDWLNHVLSYCHVLDRLTLTHINLTKLKKDCWLWVLYNNRYYQKILFFVIHVTLDYLVLLPFEINWSLSNQRPPTAQSLSWSTSNMTLALTAILFVNEEMY